MVDNRVSVWDDTDALEMEVMFFSLMFPLEVSVWFSVFVGRGW